MTDSRRIVSDGVELAAETYGEGPPLIFAHGLTANRLWSRMQLAPLANNYRIIIFDQRGHCGSTPIRDSALYNAELMAADHTAVMDEFGIERAIVGGDSMGSATVLLFALNHPERVQALILSLPAFANKLNPARDEIKEMGKLISRLGMKEFAAQYCKEPIMSPAVANRYAKDVLCSHDTASIALACETIADWVILPSLDQLTKLRFPVLVIALGEDSIHPVELSRRLKESLPDAEMTLIPSTKVYFDDVEIVGRMCKRFLKEHT